MAPQTSIPVAANVLGTIGTVFWCIQLIPQIWYNWKQKKTDGLPGLMMFIWAVSGVPFGVYAIVQGPYNRGVEWPMTLVGVISAILLAAGLIPPYFEIAKRSGRVVGINFIFISIDWMGAFFSLMALVAQHTFDVLGGVQYIVCLLLEAGIFASQLLFLLRTRSLRRRAKELDVPFDEMPEARKFVFPRPEESASAAPNTGDEVADVEKGQREAGGANENEEVDGKTGKDGGMERRERRSTSAPGAGAGLGRWPSRQ
ncbi:MAG: hypothetical protein LQ338_002509 [Usnochroma carphineum]|nr:MAG: hypothetical protein LQ338_002509 [Usnochroma carphineum]